MRVSRMSFVGAVLIGLVGGSSSLGLAQETEDPEVTAETLFELAVPSWAFPADFVSLYAGELTLTAGTDVTDEPHVSQANESMRNMAIAVTNGEVYIEPTTEALLWRGSATQPEKTPAAGGVTLLPNDAIYLPAVPAEDVDPETYLRIANPGPGDATAWMFHAHEDVSFGGFPAGLGFGSWQSREAAILNVAEWAAADEVLFRLTRYSGEPGTVLTSSAYPATTVYYIESGELERVLSGPGAELTDTWRAGWNDVMPAADVEQTLTVVGDKAASFLELVAIPRASAAS